MREQTQEPRQDRLSTLHELSEVIGELVVMDQLSISSLASLDSKDSQFAAKEFELWETADCGRSREAAEIDRLTNVILGRSQKLN